MRKLLLLVFFPLLLGQSGCSSTSGRTARVVKPKYHHRFYDRKNDKRVKRTKVVKMKG